MRESPRVRRLRSDRKAMEQLRAQSSILDFSVTDYPGEKYLVRFHGRGLWRADGSQHVALRETHEVRIKLGAAYPRMMPELTWMSPIFHPNISASGVVCLGGYGTHWVPSLSLDGLCEMLWDMIRYRNYDVDSPYNREAASWARSQAQYFLPVDERPIRDRIAGAASAGRPRGSVESLAGSALSDVVIIDPSAPLPITVHAAHTLPAPARAAAARVAEVLIIGESDEEVVDAELVPAEDQDIVFLD